MDTHNVCFCREIRKISVLLNPKKHLIKSFGFHTGTSTIHSIFFILKDEKKQTNIMDVCQENF